MRVLVLIAILLGTATATAAPAGPSADRIERARRAALDDDFQAQLPRYDGEPGEPGEATSRERRDPRRHPDGELRDGKRRDTRELEEQNREGSPMMSMFMWAIIIVFVVLLAAWIASEIVAGGGDADAPAGEAETAMSAEVDKILERPLGDADELARRGDHAEAIHTLLLRTLQELVRSAAVRVAPAMTSREILARVPLLADARDALSGLIAAVEVTHFGDEPANAGDYERCRRQFHVFAEALRANVRSPR